MRTFPLFALLLACGGRSEPDGIAELEHDAGAADRELRDVAPDVAADVVDSAIAPDVMDAGVCPVEHATCTEPGKAWCVDGFGYLLCAGGTWELYQCATRYDSTVCTHGGTCIGPRCM